MQKCAYNEASFRVPDLVGWQPNQAPVDDADDFGLRLDTRIDVDRLAGANHARAQTVNESLSLIYSRHKTVQYRHPYW